MKINVFACLSLCIVLSIVTGCAENNVSSLPTDDISTGSSIQGGENMKSDCQLIVRGNNITAGHYVSINYEERYAELPLVAVMEELGAKVKCQDETTVKISYKCKDYILDKTRGTLTEVGDTHNIFLIPPGGNHGVYYRVVDNEFIIDSDSAKLLINNRMGAKLRINYDEGVVNIF